MDDLVEGLGKQMHLTDSELQKVRIPTAVWNTSSINYDMCLVGRVLTRKLINLERLIAPC